jgi:hypothetical protein
MTDENREMKLAETSKSKPDQTRSTARQAEQGSGEETEKS